MNDIMVSWHGWNKVFWLIFVLAGIAIIIGFLFTIFSLLEVLIAFILIAVGSEKLGEEISDKRLKERQDIL